MSDKYKMSEYFYVENLEEYLYYFLYYQARRNSNMLRPLLFRLYINKNELRIVDKNKASYIVDETYMRSHRELYGYKPFKYVRVHNWESYLYFEGKKCVKLTMISDYVSLLSSKTNKVDIKDCHFRIQIAESYATIKSGNYRVWGYLNRIGKRILLSNSENKPEEEDFVRNLDGFVADRTKLVPELFERMVEEYDTENELPSSLQLVNREGQEILQKLSHFITVEQVFDYMVEQEVSAWAERKIKELLMPQMKPTKLKVEKKAAVGVRRKRNV